MLDFRFHIIAILVRWLMEPKTRPCSLNELLVLTAQTGNEWNDAARDRSTHTPLLHKHNIRFVQVARHGHLESDGSYCFIGYKNPDRLSSKEITSSLMNSCHPETAIHLSERDSETVSLQMFHCKQNDRSRRAAISFYCFSESGESLNESGSPLMELPLSRCEIVLGFDERLRCLKS